MSVKNIIFDFGGVIIDIDEQLTVNEFAKLGAADISRAADNEFIELVESLKKEFSLLIFLEIS